MGSISQFTVDLRPLAAAAALLGMVLSATATYVTGLKAKALDDALAANSAVKALAQRACRKTYGCSDIQLRVVYLEREWRLRMTIVGARGVFPDSARARRFFRDSLPAALVARYPEATRQIDVKELLDLH